jgi:adenylylsulfate kinase
LLTVKAHRLIREADLVLADASVAPVLLSLARPEAIAAFDGNTGAAAGQLPSNTNEALRRALRDGKRVVRLWSRAANPADALSAELASLSAAGIAVELVPAAAPIPTSDSPDHRRAHQGHRPAIIFLTGLSGAGKSTLATALGKRLLHGGILAAVVDGDVLRTGLSKNLGYSADVGAVVIVALISPFQADRSSAARRAAAKQIPFAEVFINAPLAVCERRDPKKLYQRARAGEIASFTGIDSPYEPPPAPTLELHTDIESIEQSTEKLTSLVLTLARPSFSGPETAN